jgi:hypothetical protein
MDCKAKEMEKVFLPLLAQVRKLNWDLAPLIRILLNFLYLARTTRLTDTKLQEMCNAHNEMHLLKRVVVRSGVYQDVQWFNKIPKSLCAQGLQIIEGARSEGRSL